MYCWQIEEESSNTNLFWDLPSAFASFTISPSSKIPLSSAEITVFIHWESGHRICFLFLVGGSGTSKLSFPYSGQRGYIPSLYEFFDNRSLYGFPFYCNNLFNGLVRTVQGMVFATAFSSWSHLKIEKKKDVIFWKTVS